MILLILWTQHLIERFMNICSLSQILMIINIVESVRLGHRIETLKRREEKRRERKKEREWYRHAPTTSHRFRRASSSSSSSSRELVVGQMLRKIIYIYIYLKYNIVVVIGCLFLFLFLFVYFGLFFLLSIAGTTTMCLDCAIFNNIVIIQWPTYIYTMEWKHIIYTPCQE